MNVDFIIVGQGLAGTCFAFELIKQKKTFIIIDEYRPNTSSRIALGIYNPLILKWFTKPWHIDNQIKYFYTFYSELNKFLKNKFFNDTGIYKFLKTPYDQNNWLTKNSSSGREQYMSSKLFSINNRGLINNDFYGFITSAGRLDIQFLLKSFRNYCVSKNSIIEQKFNYNHLVINQSSFGFKKFIANSIIFCEGYSGSKNPYFSNLNLKPTKGEILKIYCAGLNLQEIIHAGLLIVPLGNDYYSIGATYNWDIINAIPTIEAKKIIIDILNNTLNKSYSIVEHLAGIRPSTVDRRPLVGAHTKHNNMYILNGLGTRGVLLAPYLSKILVDNIYCNQLIPEEVDVNRL